MASLTRGRGGGGGFSLGPAQNVFTGATRAAAESARDTYFTNNPANLTQYNQDTALNIILEYTDNGDGVAIYQVRNNAGTEWLDNSSSRGVAGRDGMANIPNAPDGTIPMVQGGALVPSSLREVATLIESAKSLGIPDNSLNFLNLRISASQGRFIAYDMFNQVYALIGSRPLTSAGTGTFSIELATARQGPVVFQGRTDTTHTTTELAFNFTNITKAIIDNWVTRGTSGKFYIQIHGGADANARVIYRSHTPAQIADGNVFDLTGSSGTSDFVLDTSLEPAFQDTGQELYVRLLSPDATPFTILGSVTTQTDVDADPLGFTVVGQNVPYFGTRFWTIVDERVLTEADLLTNEAIQDIVADMLTSGTHSGITVNYDDAAGTISLSEDVAAADVSFDNSDGRFSSLGDDVQEAIQNLQTQVSGIVVPGQPSFRAFRTFTGGTLISNVNFRIEEITLDGTNFAEWNDVNSIYAAGRVNKRVDILLPTDAEIATSGESYPVAIEVTHLGGTDRTPADGRPNVVNFIIKSGDTGTQINTVALGLRANTGISQGDVIVLTKDAAGQNWQESRATRDPASTLLPNGVFTFHERLRVSNINAISTELAGVVIEAGEAFIVDTGGTYFGTEIRGGDVIVSKVNNPDLTTTSDDWLIIPETNNFGLTMEQIAFFDEVTRDGTRFDTSRNVFVNEANVISFNSMSSGLPAGPFPYFTSDGVSPGTARSVTFTNQNLQFADLRGGTLSLMASFSANQQSGFLPDLTDIVFDYGGGNTFTFPLTGVDPQSGIASVDITIPNQDYSAFLNTNCNITLNYQFRGATFIGSFTIMGLFNTLDGTLRQAVTDIAVNQAAMAEQRVNTRIDGLANEIDDDGAALQSIQPRLSPYKTVQTNTPEGAALFLDSTGSDNFPSDLSTMQAVSADNPRFTGGNTSLFVAVPGGSIAYTLRNITTSSDTALADADPAVTLGESRTFNGVSYFVYRVTGLTSGHVYEVERVENSRVVAWPDDIRNLQDDVERIDAELAHAALNLPDEVVDVLDNNTSVTEESTPNVSPTAYNRGLAGSTNTSQTVFYEPNENAGSGGSKVSRPLSELSGNQSQRKLLYIPPEAAFVNQASYVTAFDGSTGRDLISYVDGTFFANVFVPAKSAGTSTETVYPAPSSRVSGAGIWQTIPSLTFQNGVPVPESDELFFTRNIPTSSTTITINYRGHANGNIFGANSVTLSGVGGTNEVFTTFTLSDGSETLTVEVRWYPSTRSIRVSENARVNAGLPTINDVQVILSYTETRAIPATPATTRRVALENVHDGWQVFAFRPAASGNLAIVGDTAEIDTGYSYTTLFGSGLSGTINVGEQEARFLNFEDFTPIHTTVSDLENHATLPQFGLFSTTYTTETLFNLSVTFRPSGLNVGNLPTSATGLTSGDVWNNGGTLTIVP
jgi:hypothetical protein